MEEFEKFSVRENVKNMEEFEKIEGVTNDDGFLFALICKMKLYLYKTTFPFKQKCFVIPMTLSRSSPFSDMYYLNVSQYLLCSDTGFCKITKILRYTQLGFINYVTKEMVLKIPLLQKQI